MTFPDEDCDGDVRPERWAASCFIHPCAQVDLDTEIGVGTKVWQFASVIRKAKIGCDCSIAACSIVDGSQIGDRVSVGHGAQVHPGMQIGNDVFIGPGVILCNDIWPLVSQDGWWTIDGLISGRVVVTRICDGASIGAGAIILPGLTIGAGAMIAAGSIVNVSVPDRRVYKSRMNLDFMERIHKTPNRRRAVSMVD